MGKKSVKSVKSVKTLNRNDYVQKDIGWLELKKGLGVCSDSQYIATCWCCKGLDYRYTDDSGIPYNVSLRGDCNDGWGYIDNDGKVWKVVWN